MRELGQLKLKLVELKLAVVVVDGTSRVRVAIGWMVVRTAA